MTSKICAMLACLVVALSGSATHAQAPTRPIQNFETAKDVARNRVYDSHWTEEYCGCAFVAKNESSGSLVSTCGLQRPRPVASEGMEWEHVVPAKTLGGARACWAQGSPRCFTSSGNPLSGRDCCGRIDPEFARMESDLHNLIPSAGYLNNLRRDKPYGEVKDEVRTYGSCNFEIGGQPKVAEPPEKIWGNVARISLYMRDTYGVKFTPAQIKMFEFWDKLDPVDEWEIERDRRIELEQGNSNPYVRR